MKKFLPYLGVTVLGSAITLGAANYLREEPKEIIVESGQSMPVQGALYSVNEKGNLEAFDFTDAAEKVTPAVVHIRSTAQITPGSNPQYRRLPDPFRDFFGDDLYGGQPRKREGTGSGVIINSEGYIVTNNHVVEGADELEVTLNDNRVFKAKLIGTDPNTDLALLQVKAEDLPHLSFVNSDDVKVGEWVMAVGNPFNLNSTVTAGIVSAKGRSIRILQGSSPIESFIQTDAAINPGNSGGALVNLEGDLVGINTAIASNTGSYTGYGFAVPSNLVNKVVEDLLNYGTVQRGYLGIMISDVNSAIAEDEDLDINRGILVDSLMSGSAAREAGIEVGDVIVAVDGNTVNTVPELQERIGRRRPGDKVNLTVNRDGSQNDIEVVLNNGEGDPEVVKLEERKVLARLGAEFEEIPEGLANALDIEGGVMVSNIEGGALSRTSVQEGFIITEVNDKPVKTVEDLEQLLNERKGKTVTLTGVYENYPGKYYVAFGF
ncbi:MAG TPA: serine protease [Cytophagales bacterium]|nr:serine protease [Cytophagales bacterium]HAA21224.1 serine protease [Cytophagales bacterium]